MERILALQALSFNSDFSEPEFDSTRSAECSSQTTSGKCSTQSINCTGSVTLPTNQVW